jgi:hypothetical protein
MGDVGGAAQAAATLTLGLSQLSFQKQQARDAKRREEGLKAEMKDIEDARQDVINPYEGVEDLTGMISNPMDTLSVATQAAEFQAEEADISLANTLDTLRATGASAGGATALAQAALQSKRGISASLEQQEANNEKLRAQGEAKVMQARIAEAQRMQQADVSGREFVYGEQERRDVEQLNRLQAQITGAQQQQAAARQGAAAVTGATISSIGQQDWSNIFSKKSDNTGGSGGNTTTP